MRSIRLFATAVVTIEELPPSWSPSGRPCSVETTMSVKSTVSRARSDAAAGRAHRRGRRRFGKNPWPMFQSPWTSPGILANTARDVLGQISAERDRN